MTRERKPVAWLVEQIDLQLRKFGDARDDLSLREKVLSLSEVHRKVKKLGVSVMYECGLDPGSARERIRLYLIEYVGKEIDSIELEVVSGISEYARRIRELRVEQGYQIASGASPDPDAGVNLKPNQYLLVTAEPDRDAARRWHVANRIRRMDTGSKKRVLAFLVENEGKVVTTEELAYVAKEAREFARRVRELRTEEGYAIATRNTGRPDLGIGQYVLLSKERRAEPHDRHVPVDVEERVYRRDASTCRICAWDLARWSDRDPRILELHHVTHHQEGGENTEENMAVICNKCHDEVHAGRRTAEIEKLREWLRRTYSA